MTQIEMTETELADLLEKALRFENIRAKGRAYARNYYLKKREDPEVMKHRAELAMKYYHRKRDKLAEQGLLKPRGSPRKLKDIDVIEYEVITKDEFLNKKNDIPE